MKSLSINRWWLFEGIELPQVAKKISKYGFAGLELDVNDPSRYNGKEIKKVLNRYEVALSGIAAVSTLKEEYDLCSANENIRKRAITYVENCLAFAKEVDAPVVVILSGLKQNRNDALFGNFIESLKELGVVCEELNVKLCIENALNRVVEHSDDLLKVFKTLGSLSQYIGALFDTGHFLLGKREDLSGVATKLKQYIYHIHLDNNFGETDDHSLPQKGLLAEQDFTELFKVLKGSYQGWYSFEIRPKENETVSFILETCKKFYDAFVAQR